MIIQAVGRCPSGMGCPSGTICANGLCCPAPRCSSGVIALRICVSNAECGNGFECANGGCCPLPLCPSNQIGSQRQVLDLFLYTFTANPQLIMPCLQYERISNIFKIATYLS